VFSINVLWSKKLHKCYDFDSTNALLFQVLSCNVLKFNYNKTQKLLLTTLRLLLAFKRKKQNLQFLFIKCSQDDVRTRGESSFSGCLPTNDKFPTDKFPTDKFPTDKFPTETPASPTERPFSCLDEKPSKLTRDDSELLRIFKLLKYRIIKWWHLRF
jgi:hypothetical protein